MRAGPLLWALCALLLCQDHVFGQRPLPAELKNDREALLDLFYAITSVKPKGMINTWTTARNPCAPVWRYITCTNGRVTSISLQNLNLEGTLPGSLATMTALTTLDLSGNAFTGQLPSEWANRRAVQPMAAAVPQDGQQLLWPFIPDLSGAFPSIKTLDLSMNNLTGSIPDSWTRRGFRSLQNLFLGTNELTGSLPSTWGNPNVLPSVMQLDLSGNAFSGSLPSGWGSPNAFQFAVYIDLSNNNLSGELPASWSSIRAFPRLRDLVLSQNNLGSATRPGRLPASWTNSTAFPKLDTLVLFPGNQYICGENSPYPSTYIIIDEFGNEYNGEDIGCPSRRSLRRP